MTTSARFSIIPGWIVTDPRLKGRDLQVLCLLGRYTDKQGWCRRSQVKMAAQLDCARSTIQLSLDRLADLGVVEKREEESADGRDSAHSYRVIYDREPPSRYDSSAYQGGDEEENDPISTPSEGDPPADISAPPADPESAPPADPESAPINDPYLTTPSEKEERDGARDDQEEESPKSIERAFRAWYRTWPTSLNDSENAARKAWIALSRQDRAACIDLTPRFIAAVKTVKGKFTFSSVYLTEKGWEKLDDPTSDVALPQVHNPFSKAWSARRLSELMKDPADPPMRPTAFQQAQLDQGGHAAEQVIRERRLKYGWPKVITMHQRAEMAVGVTVAPWLAKLSEGFEVVHRTSDKADRWRELHRRNGWPWMPERVDWLFFPPGDDPADAMAEFVSAVTREQSGDDAA